MLQKKFEGKKTKMIENQYEGKQEESSSSSSDQKKKDSVFQSFIRSHSTVWFWIMIIAVAIIIILLAFYGKYIEVINMYEYENNGRDSISKFNLSQISTENYSYYSRVEHYETQNGGLVYEEMMVFMEDSFFYQKESNESFWLFFHSGNPLTVNYWINSTRFSILLGNIYRENQIPSVFLSNYTKYELYLDDPSDKSYCLITKAQRDDMNNSWNGEIDDNPEESSESESFENDFSTFESFETE